MLILGIGSLGRDSAVALMDEATPLAAIEEEKLSRTTGMGGIPRRAIELCLKQTGSRIAELSLAALANHPTATWWREAKYRLSLTVSHPGAADWTRGLGRNFRELAQLRQLRRLLIPSTPLVYFDHHLCHAASAFYTSEFDRALILTLDEGGGMCSGMLAMGEGEEIRPVCRMQFPNSPGWFYSRVTELLGLRPHRDEHKVQWLSMQGGTEYVALFRKLFARDSRGLPVLNRKYLARGSDDRGSFSHEFCRELGIELSAPPVDPAVRASLARSAQTVLEEIVLEIAQRFRKETGTDSVCLAGGVFLNVLLVRAMEVRSGFRGVYVQPVSGNAGTSLGAAFLGRKHLAGLAGRKPLSHLSFGPDFASSLIKSVLDNCKIIYRYISGEEELFAETARLLQHDRIVAWCQGPTEFGHRALGNRSILASPFSEYVIENVNRYIKHREDFHPFALSVPAERAAEWFDCTPNCRFMASLGTLKSDLPSLARFAFNDRQVRVHTVAKESNPRFWRLLHKFGEGAPAPVLVNTSFNLFGEPLVSDPREAIRSFYCAGIDALAIGNFLIVK